jgi:hypothetical protein
MTAVNKDASTDGNALPTSRDLADGDGARSVGSWNRPPAVEPYIPLSALGAAPSRDGCLMAGLAIS